MLAKWGDLCGQPSGKTIALGHIVNEREER